MTSQNILVQHKDADRFVPTHERVNGAPWAYAALYAGYLTLVTWLLIVNANGLVMLLVLGVVFWSMHIRSKNPEHAVIRTRRAKTLSYFGVIAFLLVFMFFVVNRYAPSSSANPHTAETILSLVALFIIALVNERFLSPRFRKIEDYQSSPQRK